MKSTIPTTLFGVDIASRREKIGRAHRLEPIRSAADVPVCIPIPTYFAIGSSDKPADYFTRPEALVEYQIRAAQWHLENIPDDHVPYIMPWHGTGMIPSMFGAKVYYPENVQDDPAIKEPCIHSVAEIARLRLPDPERDGLMPWVLEVIHRAAEKTDLPVGLMDMQSTLGVAGWLCGQTNLCLWMLTEPQAIEDLFALITEAIILAVKAQKEATGDAPDENQGLQGVWTPPGVGVWLSDDDAVMQSPDLYEQFCVPAVSRIFTAFGKGILHYCGDNNNKLDRFAKIENMAAINTCCMGNFQLIKDLRAAFGGRLPIIMQETAPIDIDYYCDTLFAELETIEGIVLAPWFMESIAMKRNGAASSYPRDVKMDACRFIERVRRNTARRLSGEPIREGHYPVLPGDEPV